VYGEEGFGYQIMEAWVGETLFANLEDPGKLAAHSSCFVLDICR